MNRKLAACLAASACLAGTASCQPITAEKVRKIKVCQTTYVEVKQMFGAPMSVGQLGGHTTWTYGARLAPDLIIMFDDERVVSDLAHNPSGMVELKSRCQARPAQ